MNCCTKRTDMSSNRKSIRIQLLSQQTQRNAEFQKTNQQFVNQPQTPRKKEHHSYNLRSKNEHHSYNLRSKAVEPNVSRNKTSQTLVRSQRSTEIAKVHSFGRNVNSNRKIQSDFVRMGSVQCIFLSFLFLSKRSLK